MAFAGRRPCAARSDLRVFPARFIWNHFWGRRRAGRSTWPDRAGRGRFSRCGPGPVWRTALAAVAVRSGVCLRRPSFRGPRGCPVRGWRQRRGLSFPARHPRAGKPPGNTVGCGSTDATPGNTLKLCSFCSATRELCPICPRRHLPVRGRMRPARPRRAFRPRCAAGRCRAGSGWHRRAGQQSFGPMERSGRPPRGDDVSRDRQSGPSWA